METQLVGESLNEPAETKDATEVSTPEQIDDLIHGIGVPKPPAHGTTYGSPEWRKWQDDMQAYYDRVAGLRRQMLEAVPGDMPDWVHVAVCLAWRAAMEGADSWRTATGG